MNYSFNPRPCARGDTAFLQLETLQPVFQSTPLREGRLSDNNFTLIKASVSIHAPARGATGRKERRNPRNKCFNPRPCARGDFITAVKAYSEGKFQSTPLREGRLWDKHKTAIVFMFQSTPLREGRRNKASRGGREMKFQSTPLREGRRRYCGTLKIDGEFQSTPLREGRLFRIIQPI